MAKCHLCNDQGKEGGCSRCGLTPRKSVAVNLHVTPLPADVIPIAYQGKVWSKSNNTDIPANFKQFDDLLERVYNIFLTGQLPRFSMFIAAPPKSGKNMFAYSCMQTAYAQKFKVAPLLSTADWRRLHAVSQTNPFYKLYGQYQWDRLVMLDVVFMFVTHTEEHHNDIPLIKNILDTRATFNLPTFIISDYLLTELIPKWNSEQYSMIFNPDEQRDYLRYPVIAHRFE